MNPLERLKEIASVLGLSAASEEYAWFDASNPVCRDAEKLLHSGRAAEAEEIFSKVLTEPRYAAVAKKQLPRILLALAAAQVRQKKWDAADQSAARAWALLSELRYRTTPEYAECCRLRGEAAKGRGDHEDALRLFLQGLAAVEGQKHPKPEEIVDRRIEIASLLRGMSRWQEAERMAAEAARVAAEQLPGARRQGDALREWALCLAECGRYEEAREAGEKAADVHRAACGDQSDELALDYEKLGSICQKQEDLPAAVGYLEKALGIRERQVGGDTSEIALLMVALADLYTFIGRLAPALELLQQAVGKLGPARDSSFAAALEKLGAVYTRTGRYEEAAGCYQRAYEYWAASPDDHADRIAANRQAIENLLPWLPEPEMPVVKPEAPDPGISVLREKPGPGARGPAGRSSAGLPAMTPPPLPPSAAPALLFARSPEPAGEIEFELQSGVADIPLPAAPQQPPARPAAPAPAAISTPEAASPGLRALDAAVSPKRDDSGFWGWEDLEFERLSH